MSRIKRTRPSPALVISVLALFVALGGTAAALKKNSVKSKHIKNNQVKTQDISNKKGVKSEDIVDGEVKGSDVEESSLSQVPSAASASDADTVGGNRVVEINTRATSVAAGTPILNLNGFRLKGTCPGSGEGLAADTTVANGEVASISTDASTLDVRTAFDNDFDPGDDVDLLGAGLASDRIYNINYTGGDGRNVVVQLVTEGDIGVNDCVYTGFAIG